VELPASDCEAIAQAGEAQVALAAQEVRWPAHSQDGWVGSARFEIDQEVKYRLLNGLDDIAITLEGQGDIDSYERERARPAPSTTSL
jgi:3-isopropylmalate/(R)-2-methylmalate dehydratase small subunit